MKRETDKRLFPPPAPEVVEWRFVQELKEFRDQTAVWSEKPQEPTADDLDLRGGVAWQAGYEDPAALLETAVKSLQRFLDTVGLNNQQGVPFRAVCDRELKAEEYFLTVGEDAIRLRAGSLEGIRRGIYRFEDLLRGSEGAFLKRGITHKNFWVKNRISRCFFGPIKRPPLNRDELMDDIDYYPEAYLDRLAQEGINGLWLTVELRNLRLTSFETPDPAREKRLAKLRRTVAKCLRYGIKTWVFYIEPRSLEADDPLFKEYPELRGAPGYGSHYCFCPSSETADRYLYESLYSLFDAVPGLGGVINISHGERATTCLSTVGLSDAEINCPRCGPLEHWQVLHRSLSAMLRGMRAVNPEAELISWFYEPHAAAHADWMFKLAGKMPEGVILQYNFESGVVRKQLGKPRIGGDYWLSEVGPSENFKRIAERAAGSGTEVSAKLQVGCSHEIATAPFLPVPGLLYRKYRAMSKMGCTHAMQCWYFGNYPGLMNRAAGLLAEEEFTDDEETFLYRLALPDWGDAADTVVRAWKHMSDGYAQYPLENLMGYYGPMHDGVVWPMWLRPSRTPLMQTWLSKDMPSGDTVGECLGGFTLPEALDLFERLCREWDRAMELFAGLRQRFRNHPERLRDIDLVEALRTFFRSGRNLLRFYYLRFLLISGRRRDARLWEELESLVKEEIANSERLLQLGSADSRLGYHPEAETYKVYPDKLRWRIECLQALLDGELPAVRRELEDGKAVFEPPEGHPVYKCGQGWVELEDLKWRMDFEGGELIFQAECIVPETHDYTILDLHLMDMAGIKTPWRFRVSPIITAADSAIINQSWGETRMDVKGSKFWTTEIRIPELSWNGDNAICPAYISVAYLKQGMQKETLEEEWPPYGVPRLSRLALGNFDPRSMARFFIA